MSLKKKTTRSSARAKVAPSPPGAGQPAAERRSAEAQVRALIAKFAPMHLRLIVAARRSLRKRLPTAHEVVYEYRDCFVISYSPSDRGYEGILALRASEDGVKLYFNRGKDLPDPAELLQGSGSMARWTDLGSASTLAHPAVVSLIDEAIARNRVPFGKGGSVLIRQTSAKQRRTRRRS